MNIPQPLIDVIREGRAILFLGAGASKGAKTSTGKEPPTGQQLADAIAEKFLSVEFKGKNLANVSELAISESDLSTVQKFIKSQIVDVQPASFHLLLPMMRWRAIFTTNYDQVIENAYEQKRSIALQKPILLRSNKDKYDNDLRKEESLPLVKLHGCISVIDDDKLPLILTPDHYSKFRKERSNLFDYFKELGYQCPIIFVGYGLEDPDLRTMLSEIEEVGSRPKYYLVMRNVSEVESRMWEKKNITSLKGSFQDFLTEIDRLVPMANRKLLARISNSHPIEKRLITGLPITDGVRGFLENEVDYVYEDGIPIRNGEARQFYKGSDYGWLPIQKNWDVRRELTDKILIDFLFLTEDERSTHVEFCIIKAEAGSGKTVFLKRLAWEAAESKLLCLFVRDDGRIDFEAIKELGRMVDERIFLFVDNAADRVAELEELIAKSRKINLNITIIVAERANEWNVSCSSLVSYVSRSFELPYLEAKEIKVLLQKLEEHKSLGFLESLSEAERIKYLSYKAGRQLLVALHEATSGKPFEEILKDEYRQISPQLAQSIYLTVCVLNSFRVPVRVGLISRIFDVQFSDFKERLFMPLEHIIQVNDNKYYGDFIYSARHPLIASIIFEKLLSNPTDKLNEFKRILSKLNLSYSSDQEAFRKIVHGRSLINFFPDVRDALEVFDYALVKEPNDPYLYHQRGIYEMRGSNPNFAAAEKFLLRSRELDENDFTVIHSLAELARLRSERATTNSEKIRYRNEAQNLSELLLRDKKTRSYGRHTLIKLAIDKLTEGFAADQISDEELKELIENIESFIHKSLQESPDDAHLLATEARFREVIQQDEKAFIALKKAFEINKKNPYIASSLARIYLLRGNAEDAEITLSKALDANRSVKSLHYQLADLFRVSKKKDPSGILYHLKKSFSPDDQAYPARFWYAYYCFLSGEKDKIAESLNIFYLLRNEGLPYETRTKVRAFIEENDEKKIFSGIVRVKEESFAFLECAGIDGKIFLHMNDAGPDWLTLVKGSKIKFNIGFSFQGPTALNVSLV